MVGNQVGLYKVLVHYCRLADCIQLYEENCMEIWPISVIYCRNFKEADTVNEKWFASAKAGIHCIVDVRYVSFEGYTGGNLGFP